MVHRQQYHQRESFLDVAIYGFYTAALHLEEDFAEEEKQFTYGDFYVDEIFMSLPSARVDLLEAAREMLAI